MAESGSPGSLAKARPRRTSVQRRPPASALWSARCNPGQPPCAARAPTPDKRGPAARTRQEMLSPYHDRSLPYFIRPGSDSLRGTSRGRGSRRSSQRPTLSRQIHLGSGRALLDDSHHPGYPEPPHTGHRGRSSEGDGGRAQIGGSNETLDARRSTERL